MVVVAKVVLPCPSIVGPGRIQRHATPSQPRVRTTRARVTRVLLRVRRRSRTGNAGARGRPGARTALVSSGQPNRNKLRANEIHLKSCKANNHTNENKMPRHQSKQRTHTQTQNVHPRPAARSSPRSRCDGCNRRTDATGRRHRHRTTYTHTGRRSLHSVHIIRLNPRRRRCCCC